MFSLSTSWNSSFHNNGYDLVDEIRRIGFDTIELNFALTENIVNDIFALSQKKTIKVSSLHNMCPLPKEIAPDEASPDYYSLASPNEAERALAVKAAKNTIACANKFGAKAVILHAGRVEIKDRIRDLVRLIDDRVRFDAYRTDMMNERIAKGKGYLDNVMKSLDELIPYATGMNVALGIENRYYYREIPIENEFEIIFNNFKPGSLYYWHDVGHAEVFERLGLGRHRDLLHKFSSRLIGVHLHDIIGAVRDHRAPGFGTFDFKMLKPYLKDETIKVVEVHQPATGDEIRKGAEYLAKILRQAS